MKRDNNGGEENEKKKLGGRKRGLCWKFLEKEREDLAFKMIFLFFFIFFSKANATCPILIGAKRGPLFLLIYPILRHKKRKKKTGPFWMLKSSLSLRATSLVLVFRISLHPSGPVFKGRQYIYQNAQNETLSVVQRLVLFNYKL